MENLQINEVLIKNGKYFLSIDGTYSEDVNGSFKDMIYISFSIKSLNINYCTIARTDNHEEIYFENFVKNGKNICLFPINDVNIKKLSFLAYNFLDEGKIFVASFNIYEYILKNQPDIKEFFSTSSKHSELSESESDVVPKLIKEEPFEEKINNKKNYSDDYYNLLNGTTNKKLLKTNNYENLEEEHINSDEDETLECCMICLEVLKIEQPFCIINDINEDKQKYHQSCLEEWLRNNCIGLISKNKVKSYCIYNPKGKMIKLVFFSSADKLYKKIAKDRFKISYDKRVEENQKFRNYSDIDRLRNEERYSRNRINCIIS